MGDPNGVPSADMPRHIGRGHPVNFRPAAPTMTNFPTYVSTCPRLVLDYVAHDLLKLAY